MLIYRYPVGVRLKAAIFLDNNRRTGCSVQKGRNMNGLTLFYTIFAYVAIAIFLISFLIRIWKNTTTPSLLKIPLTLAPANSSGAVCKMIQEVGFFKSLFYGNRLIWVGSYLMHPTLLLVLIKHFRFFFTPAPASLNWITTSDAWVGY